MINRKRTYRLYKAKNLAVDHRRRRRPPERERLRLVAPERRNQRWSMDFASDALWTRRRFRCLCIVDDGTRESPALLADFSIAGARVTVDRTSGEGHALRPTAVETRPNLQSERYFGCGEAKLDPAAGSGGKEEPHLI